VAVEHDTTTIGNLLGDADRQKLVLPNFQREFVWALDAQRRLVASLLADVPIGAVLLLHGQPDDYVSRRIALMQDAAPTPECTYLLDGQQRLSTLAVALSSPFNRGDPWKATWDSLPAKLRYVWRLRVVPLEQEEDIFGYTNLIMPDRMDVEPDELAGFLAPARVLVKEEISEKAWYHPNWGVAIPETERRLQIAMAAAKEGLVPLWGLREEDEFRLVDKSLQIIAGQRRTILHATANFDETPDLYMSLRDADAMLPADPKNASTAQIDQAFSSLAERWRNAVLTQIKAMLKRTAPTISLQRDDVARAVAIFEVINQGGTPLTPFDLIVAKNARHAGAKNLSQMLITRLQTAAVPVNQAAWFQPGGTPSFSSWNIEGRDICVSNGSLTSAFKNAFLNLLSLHFHSEKASVDALDVKHIKRAAILSIPRRISRKDGLTSQTAC